MSTPIKLPILTLLAALAGATAAVSTARAYDSQNLPPNWQTNRCPASWYGTDDGCDCGCGAKDPDCADAKRTSCDYSYGCDDPGLVVSMNNWRCSGDPLYDVNAGTTSVPPAWWGEDWEYRDHFCTCGMGSFDPACSSAWYTSCEDNYCHASNPNPNANWICDTGWDGNAAARYHDNVCDCGYGEWDTACSAATSNVCQAYNPARGSAVMSTANWTYSTPDLRGVVPYTRPFCAPVATWSNEHYVREEALLKRINEIRVQGAFCGGPWGYQRPTHPVRWEPALRCAARVYSKTSDMTHAGTWERLEAAGFSRTQAMQVGENLASVPLGSWGAVVAGWLASPDHCATLMDPQYHRAGIGIDRKFVLDLLP